MKYLSIILALVSGLVCSCSAPGTASSGIPSGKATSSPPIRLPAPRLKSDVSLEEALMERRSVRGYAAKPLSLEEVAQLLWSAQGVTAGWGGRTAPSAGALYPLRVYLASGNVTGLAPGLYEYLPEGHELARWGDMDIRSDLSRAAIGQEPVREGAIDIVITAIYARRTGKYGDRGVRYADIEAGHAAQNVCLQAVALGLGTVTIGAFDDRQVRKLLGASENETPLYIMPVGRVE